MSNNDKQKATSKLGRKGDPRMHRAVSARLANPDISLFEALQLGGFDYPTNDDASVMDSEKVTLGQRKNQLSRRLRLARKQNKSGGDRSHSPDSGHDDSSARAGPTNDNSGSLSVDPQKELQKLMQNSKSTNPNPGSLGARALEMKDQFPADLDDDDVPEVDNATIIDEPQPKRARVAKFHTDFAPLFVPPPKSMRSNLTPTNAAQGAPNPVYQTTQQNSAAASAAAQFPNPTNAGNMGTMNMGAPGLAMGATGGFPTQPFFNTPWNGVLGSQQEQQPRASSVAIKSLSSSAQAVGMTLEQLAMALASHPSKLAAILAESEGENGAAKQQDVALHLYHNEAKALYSKCMLMAGIDPKQCEENSPTHLQFAVKAWQAEGKRLHDLMGSNRDAGEAPMNVQKGKAKKAASASAAHSLSHSHEHSHDHHHSEDGNESSTSHDTRHVHRLDGQCGHKAIIHQPKGGNAHIDFVIGNQVECYNGIEPVAKNFESLWPSKYKCSDYKGSCTNKCGTVGSEADASIVPKIIHLKDINLQDPEWNYDVNSGGLMGLFKLGERGLEELSV